LTNSTFVVFCTTNVEKLQEGSLEELIFLKSRCAFVKNSWVKVFPSRLLIPPSIVFASSEDFCFKKKQLSNYTEKNKQYNKKLFNLGHIYKDYKGLFVLLFLSIIKLSIHLLSNVNYGFHRDELLYLALGEHLDWGYMGVPPFIAFMAQVTRFLFGDSLLSIRIFPALVGVSLIWLTGLMVKEMKGGVFAQMLSGLCILATIGYYRSHTLFQPVCFDQFFWALGYYLLLRYINTKDTNFLIFLGITAGIGLLNKYTMLFWGSGVIIGLLLSPYRRIFLSKWTWLAGLISFLIFLPNLIWQYQHDFPTLIHLSELYRQQLNQFTRLDFIIGQMHFTDKVVFPLWLFAKKVSNYRIFGIIYLATLFLLTLAKGKHYYLGAIYPILYAGASVGIERILTEKRKFLRIAIVTVLIIGAIPSIPYATPILPIDNFIKYTQKLGDEVVIVNKYGRVENLTNDYADMFGWEEQVELLANIYYSLEKEEQENCILWADNYGEAGAINFFGKKRGLPKPVCAHASFYLWGPGDRSGNIAITIGIDQDVLERYYEDISLIEIVKHNYAIDYEHEIPIYLCRYPIGSFRERWGEHKYRIFI
jgi:hypothetical protein